MVTVVRTIVAVVGLILVAGAEVIAVVVRLVTAQYVLDARLPRVVLGKGRGVVYLEGMLHGVLIAVHALVAHTVYESLPVISGLAVSIEITAV